MVSFKVKLSGSETTYDIDDVDENLFVGEVKGTVEVLVGVPKESQKWIYKGRILTDQITISDAKIDEGNTVIVMKTAATAASGPARTSASSASTATFPVPAPTGATSLSTVSAFDRAMFQLLENPDENIILNAVTLLLKIISNILSNPNEEKYRKISKVNAAFSKRLGALTGGSSCMEALGFILQGDDWVLVPSGEAWENLLACKKKLEKFSEKLALSLASKPASNATSAPPVPAAPPISVPPQAPVDGTTPQIDAATMLLMQQLIQGLASASVQPSAGQGSLPPTGSSQEGNNQEAAAEVSLEATSTEDQDTTQTEDNDTVDV